MGEILQNAVRGMPFVERVWGKGLFIAVQLSLKKDVTARNVVEALLAKGLVSHTLGQSPRSIRLTPPLTITEHELHEAIEILRAVFSGL